MAIGSVIAVAVVVVSVALVSRRGVREGGDRSEREAAVAVPTQAVQGARDSAASWEALWIEAREVENYPGLVDMTSLASVVLEGTVESVETGRVYALDDLEYGGAVKYVLASVRVDDVLAGDGVAKGGLVRLELGPIAYQDSIEHIADGIAGDHGLFFLRLKGDGVPEFGVTGNKAEAAEGFYRAVSSQGIFLDENGTVRLGLYPYDEGFPANLQGEAFDALVSKVHSIAEDAGV